ncbi:hypothetical protein [Mesonia sp. K7]|uniref:hypothetical protein n=1 Tax=Mesonia sp. K7 TaxID=2218606 RepID=UPI000DA96D91|nr:hypothetical protein [Mesonia sp. K7]PZD77616.1 hypothetical protein DNG35_08525 [Mesonia sp. K7]
MKNLTKKQAIKKSILLGLGFGLIHASLMAGYYYSKGENFHTERFLFHFSTQSLFMILFYWFVLKNQIKKEN